MEKKDIILLVFVLVVAGVSRYMRSLKKKQAAQGGDSSSRQGKLSDQPDDYEPYSKKQN